MSDSDGDIVELTKDSSIVSRSHSTFGSICMWLKKRRKVIGSHQSKSEDDIDALECSSSSLSISTSVKMNDPHNYMSSTSLKNIVDNDEVATEVEADDSQPQSYDTSDTDNALDDSLSTVKMSELVLSSRHLVHEALEYERCLRTQTVRKS